MTAEARVDLKSLYLIEINQLGYCVDDAQLDAVIRLQRILDDLARRNANKGLAGRFRRWLKGSEAPVRGVYLWGGVGRGKTFLMDLFYRSIPTDKCRRVHFHRFMLEIHRELNERKSQSNPLDAIAADIAADASILCFDELFVADIMDAMVLARLFKVLVERGVVLVFTSNTHPANLYRDGLQRERFLPAIKLIESHCEVFNLDGGVDYRLKTLQSANAYLCPHDDVAEQTLKVLFYKLCGDEPVDDQPLELNGRQIPVRMASEGICWFEFDGLCVGPRSKADYTELSRFYHTLLVSDIPLLGVDGDDPARRFIELIDELYDRRVNVLVSAATRPELLYRGKRLTHAFERTASRLREFSSDAYMASSHRP